MTNTTRAENDRSTSSSPRKLFIDGISLCAALALERHDTTDKLIFELMQSEGFSSLENRRRSFVKEQADTSDDVLEKPSLQYRASYVLWAADGENVDDDIDFANIFQASDMSWIAEAVPILEPASSSPLSANPTHLRNVGQISVVSPIQGSNTKTLDDDDDNSESGDTQQRLGGNKKLFNELDVLLGRGGLVNLHPGNQTYLQHKERLQARYLAASKEEKTEISQELVDIVHEWGGRFMKQREDDEHIWYEVDNLKARKKASQTLREINTPEHRAYKRKLYVEKKRAKKARTTD
jgi:hypothetical protein